MTHLTLFSRLATLVLAIASFPPSAHAQQLIGASLYAASPGTVTMRYVGSTGPIPVTWTTLLGWSTGPGPRDFATSNVNNQWFTNFPGVAPNLDTTISRSNVSRGDPIYVSTTFLTGTFPNWTTNQLVHTGTTKDFSHGGLTSPPSPTAVVFRGPHNTAVIGFSWSALAERFANMANYSVRVVVSNVCVK